MNTRTALPLLALVGLLGPGAGLHAQLPADADWSTTESAHFRVTYAAGLEELARHAAASAERAHAALTVLVADAPDDLIDIVVADNVDFSNGYATPFPSNRIVIYAKPPSDVLDLQYMRDWIDLVVTHELAHIFHLDVSGSIGHIVRTLFGRVPIGWPVYTALGSPSWSVEGLAVATESAVTGFGRARGSYHEMVVRTASIEDEIDSIDRLTSTSPEWPGAARVYIYGSLFFDYLSRRHGPDAAARVIASTAGQIVPAQIWFGRIGRSALGVSFRDAYEAWRSEMDARYEAITGELTEQGLTVSQTLTDHGGEALYPRFSPDGRYLAYAAGDRRIPPQTRVIDAADGTEVSSRRRNDVAAIAWLPDGRLLTTELDYVDPFRVYSDADVVSPDGEHRITHRARLLDIDVSRAGRAVAVQVGGGTNRLILLNTSDGSTRVIADFDRHTHWALPRFSPGGDRIAVGRWRVGGIYDIVVMDTLGRAQRVLSAGAGISAAPSWSPNGQWLLFWSDRTGIPNLFAIDSTGAVLRQVTNVLTGAFFPDVSPDGRTIAFSAYHHDGFRIERIPFDPNGWRDPMPEALLGLSESRGTYTQPDAAGGLLESAAAASDRADTLASAAGSYRPLRHLRPHYWLPALSIGETRDDFFGILTSGSDLVGRHDWGAALMIAPSSGRTQGSVGYRFNGLPPWQPSGLHPTLSLSASRDWEELVAGETSADLFIEEREDIASATLGLSLVQWRAISGLDLSAERVRLSRHLGNADSLVLRDPADDLLGVRASAHFANAVAAPFAISRENGVTLRLSGRHRWERQSSRSLLESGATTDASYSELTTSNAVYLALPLPGFARHVLAARFSGLFRAGAGATLSNIGGASSTGLDLDIVGQPDGIGGSSHLLPVRGFRRGQRHGTRAWSASAEYRFPIALVTRSLRPLPLFVDRLSGAGFVDAGHAWCDTRTTARVPAGFCSFTSASTTPLVAAGAEITARFSAWGAPLSVRFSAAVPVTESPDDFRLYLLFGPSF